MGRNEQSKTDFDIAAWKIRAAGDPKGAAQLLRSRLSSLLPLAQQAAVFAWLPAPEDLEFALRNAAMGPLAGVPYVLKDLYALAGVPTKAGSSFLQSVRPTPQCDGRLVSVLKQCGAVCAGKTHLYEFAYGLTGENPFYGNCDNPRSPGRTTGGSSSGSAAAVAAGVVPFSIGTDTGGSIRVPAAFCGLYGFRHRPEHPWITDAFPLAPSCDTAGWFTNSAKDLLLLQQVLVGLPPSRKVPRGLFLSTGRLDAQVKQATAEAARGYCTQADGASEAQLLEAFRDAGQTYTVLTSSEAAQLHGPWLDSLKDRYSKAVWERIDRGRHWSEAQLLRAASNRQYLKDTLASYFLTYDYLLMPASPCAAIPHADCAGFDRTRILDLTAPASLAGLPVLSLPLQMEDGLHAGLQVILPRADSPVVSYFLEASQKSVV